VHALTPGDYTKIYQLQPLYSATPTALNGTGTTIAIVARSDANFNDFSDFRNLTGIAPGQLINTLAEPPDPGFDSRTADAAEADLDAEWAGAIAPGATINMVVSESTATTDGVDLAAAYIVDHDLAPVMNVSFGECEADLGAAENAFFNGLWQQAAAQGTSVMVSAGDSGAAGCDLSVQASAATHGLAVSGIASTPFNTAVGGTQFQESGQDALFWNSTNSSSGVSVKGYIPEVGWNESCDPAVANSPCASLGLFLLGSTGGGSSSIYTKPSWQDGIPGMPADLTRDIPDLSLSAAGHDGYVICFNLSCITGQVAIIGGTSASSPSFAGMVAIVNQALGRQGLANYRLYELAQNPNAFCNSATRLDPSVPPPSSCLFNDVIFGSNGVPGLPGFLAGSSYDRVTGLGSVNAANLVNAWKAISLAGSSLLIQSGGADTIVAVHGQPVPLTATVSSLSGGASPTGGVALTSSVSGPVGAVAISPARTAVSIFDGTVGNLPGGTYTLTGHYSGDGLFSPSDSNPVSVTITPEASTTTLRAFGISSTGQPVAATSFPYGSFMDFHADVAGASGQGIATGDVTFTDSASTTGLGAAPINLKNEAEFVMPGGANNFPSALSIGTHTISAIYLGDNSFDRSSGQVALTITKGIPTVDPSTFSDSSFIATQPGRLDARVIPSGNIAPTGTVQYFDGGTTLGTPVQLNGNQAPFSPTFTTQGQHTITASYSGDATYNAEVSPPFVVDVGSPFSFGGATNTSLSATVKAGQNVTYNLAATAIPTFNGTVTFTCSSPSPGVTCSANPASLVINPSISNPFTVTVSTSATASLRHQPFFRWPGALAGAVAVVLAGFGKKSHFGQKSKTALGFVAITLVLGVISCGGGGSSTPPAPPPPPPPTHATLAVTGTSGTFVNTLTLNLTITH
ncbi:MAG TPA: Ig-like domain repeat protein, partial [Verrucomicrobiae bacterium]|nr:Ig-like domain repeat protein [Verrucomicrobiae bacterium]